MANSNLISVLMPCYNAGLYIRDAVDSILKQTYHNFELLLIDDGSTDDTTVIIKEYALLDSRVVAIFNEKNLGLIKSLNKGVQLAKGEYIARMDADDISAINRIEVLLNAFIANPNLDVISAGFHMLSHDGKVLQRIYPKAIDSIALKFVSFFCTPVNHPCVMVKSGVFKQNYFDELFIHSEDYEMFSRLLLSGYYLANLPVPLYYLRKNPESVSYKYEQIQISTHTKISSRNIDIYFHKKFDFFIHKIMINRISFNVSPKLLNEALEALNSLRTEFIERENLDANQISQINDFLTEQKIDIYFQSFKYANYLNKLKIGFLALFNIKIYFSKRGIQYIKSKYSFSK